MSAISIDSVGAGASGEIGAARESAANVDAARAKEAVSELDFGQVLDTVAAQQNRAAEKSEAFARGALDDIHGTMIAMKEAEISLKLVGSVRNKILDAFQELWRTNV